MKSAYRELGRLLRGSLPFAIVNAAPNNWLAASMSYTTAAEAEAAGHELILQKGGVYITSDDDGRVAINCSPSDAGFSPQHIFTTGGSIGVGVGNANPTDNEGGNLWGQIGSILADNSARLLKASTGSIGHIILVNGSQGSNFFSDLVHVTNSSFSVISSRNSNGSPGARTYSQAAETLKVAINGGSTTYTIRTTGFGSNQIPPTTTPTMGT